MSAHPLRADKHPRKYRKLAKWLLEHQADYDYDDADIDNLADALARTRDAWLYAMSMRRPK